MAGRHFSSFVLATALAFTGCATKKYVTQTTTPIKSQVDQVEAKVTQQGQEIDKQKQQIDNQQTGLSATNERAVAADQRAGDAINRADQAGQKADTANQKAEVASTKSDRNAKDIGDLRTDLRQVITNIDDYKPVKETVVAFGFNKDTLTPESKQKLDELVANKGSLKHYFIAVEGFTDKTGPADYNAALSRRRADRVVQYLVAQHDIPIYRIHMVGLGAQKPAEEGRGREVNAKNRRVEVTIFSSDLGGSAATANLGNR